LGWWRQKLAGGGRRSLVEHTHHTLQVHKYMAPLPTWQPCPHPTVNAVILKYLLCAYYFLVIPWHLALILKLSAMAI